MMTERRHFLIGALAGSVGLSVGALGNQVAASESNENPTAADIGFCTDMAAHHVQALALCQRVLGRDTGDAVQAAAGEVLQNQAIEVGMMRAWLTDWGASTLTPDVAMAWMHDGDGMPVTEMPGYASADQLRALSLASGREQGRLWIELIRAHHVGGVEMATAAMSLAPSAKVVRLARTQADVQTFEIAQYDLLLTGEYADALGVQASVS